MRDLREAGGGADEPHARRERDRAALAAGAQVLGRVEAEAAEAAQAARAAVAVGGAVRLGGVLDEGQAVLLRQRELLATHAAGDEQGEIVRLMQQELRAMQLGMREVEKERDRI